MARKKNIPEEEIVNVTCEEAVPAEETLEDTTPPDETGADTGSFSADLPDTSLPAEGSAEMSETLPTVDETAEETPSSDGGDAWGEAEESSKLYEEKAELPDTAEDLNAAPIQPDHGSSAVEEVDWGFQEPTPEETVAEHAESRADEDASRVSVA